jgi:predicted glycoside hydrolase/deacetylase ChbG (UPF0249 family)
MSAGTPVRLIVNADDFGQTAGINAGVARCHEHGILTSASLMVRWPHAAAAVEYATRHAALSVGLHVDLGEWISENGEWRPLYSVVDPADVAAVSTEILRQLATFRRLMGTDPTHLDSHQHVHTSPPAERIVRELGAALGIPVRQRGPIRYVGAFYGQDHRGAPLPAQVSTAHLVALIENLGPGTTELSCHPGLAHDAVGMYVAEREREVEALCDPAVRLAVEARGVALISFRDVATGGETRS